MFLFPKRVNMAEAGTQGRRMLGEWQAYTWSPHGLSQIGFIVSELTEWGGGDSRASPSGLKHPCSTSQSACDRTAARSRSTAAGGPGTGSVWSQRWRCPAHTHTHKTHTEPHALPYVSSSPGVHLGLFDVHMKLNLILLRFLHGVLAIDQFNRYSKTTCVKNRFSLTNAFPEL